MHNNNNYNNVRTMQTGNQGPLLAGFLFYARKVNPREGGEPGSRRDFEDTVCKKKIPTAS